MLTRIAFASVLFAASSAAGLAQNPRDTGKKGPSPSAPSGSSTQPRPDAKAADLAVTGLVVNQAAKTVTATVTFDSRIGLRGVPVRLRVTGGGAVQFEKTSLVDMATNSTNEVTFKVDTAGLLAALPAPTNPAAPKFLSVTVVADPENAIAEAKETNNTAFRILNAR